MPLPPGIASEVLRYLLLEYGESPDDPDALKLSELSYEGERVVDGKPVHFWSYPSSGKKAYAIVELSADGGYTIGMSEYGPDDERPRRWWQFWR